MNSELYVRVKHKGHFMWINLPENVEDAVKKVRSQLNITPDVDIVFADSDGAIIQNDFLADFVKIHGKGVILQVLTNSADEISVDAVSDTSTLTNENTSNYVDSYKNDEDRYRNIASCGPETTFDFDLKTLLETSPLGKSDLIYYQNFNILDNTRRNRLVDVICRHIYCALVQSRIRHDGYNILASKIIGLFPNENSLSYYTPAIKKKDSSTGKHIPARGKLVDKIKKLIYIGKTPETTKTQETAKGSVDPTLVDARTWLQTWNEPWEEVVEKWKITFPLRQIDSSKRVEQIFQTWPVLLDKRAISLINLDFDLLFPSKGLHLINDWDIFFNKIYSRHSDLSKAVKELSSYLDDEYLDANSKLAVQLKILCHLIPCYGRKRLATGHWKFSIRKYRGNTTACNKSK